MEKKYTCIVCPLSCVITVEDEEGKLIASGFSCKRGHDYAINEHQAPKRMITGTVAIVNGSLRRIPVVGTGEIPKNKMKDAMRVIRSIVAVAPIRCGEVVIRDICETGVDMVAARDVCDTTTSRKLRR